MELLPIDPTRTQGGALVALVQELGEAAAQPVALAEDDDPFTNFNVISSSISVAVAAKLNIGSIFGAGTTISDQGFYYDAMTFTDKYLEQADEGQVLRATRWGVGLRVLLRVYDVKGNLSLNFGLVGAAVDLQQARAQYQITGIGLGLDGLAIVLGEIPNAGSYTSETFYKLNTSVVRKLATYILEHKGALKPQPVAVGLVRPIDPILTARSYYFAMRQLAERASLRDALNRAGAKFDRDAIRAVYNQLAADTPEDARPPVDVERRAEQWLQTSA